MKIFDRLVIVAGLLLFALFLRNLTMAVIAW